MFLRPIVLYLKGTKQHLPRRRPTTYPKEVAQQPVFLLPRTTNRKLIVDSKMLGMEISCEILYCNTSTVVFRLFTSMGTLLGKPSCISTHDLAKGFVNNPQCDTNSHSRPYLRVCVWLTSSRQRGVYKVVQCICSRLLERHQWQRHISSHPSQSQPNSGNRDVTGSVNNTVGGKREAEHTYILKVIRL